MSQTQTDSGAPLAGRRIAVTRPEGQASPLLEGVRALGGTPLACPTVRLVPPTDPEPLVRAVADIAGYDWVVFTSANGVERFFAVLDESGGLWPAETSMAAIGPATAAAARARGVRASVVPAEYVAEAVAEDLIASGGLAGSKILLPRALGARAVLRERLQEAGAIVEDVVAYESRPDDEGIDCLRAGLEAGEIDMVTFTAASTVERLVEAIGPDLGRARVAAIGPITAEAARSRGVRVDVVAEDYTVEGLLQAMERFYTNQEH